MYDSEMTYHEKVSQESLAIAKMTARCAHI